MKEVYLNNVIVIQPFNENQFRKQMTSIIDMYYTQRALNPPPIL